MLQNVLLCLLVPITRVALKKPEIAEKRGEVISELKRHIQFKAVILLQTADHHNAWSSQMTRVQLARYLIIRFIPTTAMAMNSSQQPLQSTHPGQLVVLLTSDLTFLRNVFEKYQLANVVYLVFLELGQSLQDLAGDSNIPFDVQFIVAQPSDVETRLFEVYRVAPGTPLRVQLLGALPRSIAATEQTHEYVYRRRTSLGDHTIRTSSLNNSFLVWVNEDKTIGGFYGKVWADLEQHLNFKSDVIVPASGLWGRKHINNTWDGVIGMVNRGEAEVGVCDIAMNAERVGVVSYTMQIATFHYKVFIRKGDEDVSWVSFLQAFSAGLWLAIVASVFVMALALKICFHVGLLQGKEHPRHNKFHDWLFATLGALICLQGQTSAPLSVQCRLVYILPYVLGSVLLCAYSAAVISFLTVHKTNQPITGVEQLHNDKTYEVGAVQNSSTFVSFQESREKLFQAMYKERLQPNQARMPKRVLNGLRRVCRDKRYAFMAPVEETVEHLPYLSCAVIYLPEGLFEMKYGIVFNERSPYVGIFRYTLQKLRETGAIQKSHQDTMRYRPRTDETAVKGVELVDVIPVLSFLASGILVAVFLVLLERLVTQKDQRPR